jgi:hypothetical protein
MMNAPSADSSRARIAAHVWLRCFLVLSAVALAAGWVLTMFDSQYEATALIERALVAIIAGAFGAVIVSPASALVSLIAAGVAWLRARRPDE